MAYDLAKVTANGNNLIAQILANKSSLSVDKIEISDTQLPSTTDISTMTSVPKVVQTVSANGFSKNSNTLIISTVVDNSSIRADYKAWVFGIWGSDSQNGQSQLIAVITSTNSPDTIPAFSGRTPVSYTYKFNIGFSNASQIQFNMIDDSFATNDTVVHTTGDETIDGQKKFKTDPTDSAGNAYAKTVDVNQQLDKKVNVADMRKPASDVAGIDEVNAKQDKIGYTPADDSKVVHSGDLLGGRNYAIWGKILTVTDNGSGNNYPNELAFEISPDVWGKQVTISYTATVSGFNETPDAYVDLKLYNALGGDYTSRGSTQLIAKDGDYPVVWKGYIGDLASRGKSQGNFRTSLNSGAKITISKLMIELGNVQHDWVPAIEDKADDSKVAHLSGANNFDTVPTVKNNPLLLASSLPSDVARLSQDANFTAKLQQNGQDVALANNTIARNPNTGKATDAIDFDPGKLTIGGNPAFSIVMCTDEADAKAKSAADPHTLYVYPKES